MHLAKLSGLMCDPKGNTYRQLLVSPPSSSGFSLCCAFSSPSGETAETVFLHFFFFFNQFVGAELSLEAHAALAVRHTWACLVVRTLEHEYMPLL